MRISGGLARGIPLRTPRGVDLRPAMDRLRQGVFSSLGERVKGARFADLFAGTGSYGLEALSRGAAGGVFVESNRRAVPTLQENIRAVCRSAGVSEDAVRIHNMDALSWSTSGAERPDLVFIDPPFDDIPAVGEKLLSRLRDLVRDEPEPFVVFEMPGEVELHGEGWRLLKRIGSGRDQPTCCLYVLDGPRKRAV